MTRITKTTKVKKQESVVAEAVTAEIVLQTNRDMITALLIVSLTVNLFVLIGWIALQVTTAYDTQVASFLFTR